MSENVLSRAVTRRTFLKATAATAAVAAMGDKLFGGPISTLVECAAAAAKQVTEDVWFPSACYMCFSNCGTVAHRVNGVVVKIEGNPEHPQNQGRVCARAQAGLMKLYNPWRFKTPVKRTNPEKGRDVDPGWVEITWEEALDIVGDKLGKIHEEDPKKLLYMTGWGTRLYGGSTRRHVGTAFGTPNWISGPGGMTCAAAWHDIGYITNGTSSATGTDFKYCNYLVTIGSSIGLNKADPEVTREFWEARERGMMFVVVDTRLDAEGTKADEWIPIRGGTDLAFLLALNHVPLYELDTYDVDFIKNRTNGTYLIRSDDGLYVRSSTEILPPDPSRKDQELGKPYIWDSVDNKAKTFDDPTIQDYALEGTFAVEGVECKPAFHVMKEAMREYTPEWAEDITTVPAETIRRIAKEMLDAAQIGSTIVVDGVEFPYRPVQVGIGRGGQTHKFGTLAVQACVLLNLLLGSAETPGGNTVGAVQETGPDGTNLPKGTGRYRPVQYPPDYRLMDTYWPTCYKTFWATWDAVLNPEKYGIDYELEMLLFSGANPIFGFGSPHLVTEAIKKIPFVAAISYHSDEPTELADVVLPEPGYTEWLHDVYGTLRQPLVAEPLYSTKIPEEIYTELAARSGWLADWNQYLNERLLRLKDPYKLDLDKKYTQAEIMDRKLKSSYGEEYGLDWFKEHGVRVRPSSEKENYGYYHNPQTRYHLYLEYIRWAAEELKKDLAAVGAEHPYPGWEQHFVALPSWEPNPTFTSSPEFDLFENNFRSKLMSMGFSPDNPWTNEAMQFDPYPVSVWINRDTAEKKGLKDGDLVWLESYVGEPWAKVQGEVLTSEGVHPESCIIGGQWGRWAVNMNPIAKEGPHHNSLLSIELPYVDHFGGNIEMGSKVKIYKA